MRVWQSGVALTLAVAVAACSGGDGATSESEVAGPQPIVLQATDVAEVQPHRLPGHARRGTRALSARDRLMPDARHEGGVEQTGIGSGRHGAACAN